MAGGLLVCAVKFFFGVGWEFFVCVLDLAGVSGCGLASVWSRLSALSMLL